MWYMSNLKYSLRTCLEGLSKTVRITGTSLVETWTLTTAMFLKRSSLKGIITPLVAITQVIRQNIFCCSGLEFAALWRISNNQYVRWADPSGHAVEGVGLRPLNCWDCGFEYRRGHGCLLFVVCCQAEVSASGWSLVQRSPTGFGGSNECDGEAP